MNKSFTLMNVRSRLNTQPFKLTCASRSFYYILSNILNTLGRFSRNIEGRGNAHVSLYLLIDSKTFEVTLVLIKYNGNMR